MLNAIISFSIKHKLIIGLLVFALIGWGIYSLTKLPIDAVPDITNNQVLVITSAPGLGAPDVERFITVPIEQATRNVSGIIEQRSFSRFGLSLVTIVFDDGVDVYWARQQISERLLIVREQIPQGMGTPELGPVTTGLGEVFQYVVKAKKGYEGKYDLIQLREIQDWIIRRQLLGTDGIADVSSFGGLLKQYEVAIDPEKLKSLNLTITEVFDRLQNNNQNTGGAYIEKGETVLFIRSEGLVGSIADIENIVVKRTATGAPVLVRDLARVKIGSAVRYGAMNYNADGEVAGAVVMMLKGGNSNKVIANVKSRIKEIEKTLPEGVEIVPFLDRTKMVNNAISTVEKNLLEGALIVIFVLVLFLGNLRAGFVVASIIPLSMLFAFGMMSLFGVSGNLMSLGAIDFGLLVDGAVIIVEAVTHRLSFDNSLKNVREITQKQMDGEVKAASSKMMNSAVFGQIIILIVYLPVLSLQGIEGKMFKPMAQTVSFAILGAFLLSVTYVPMMSSIMLSKKLTHKETFSDKMMKAIQRLYTPSLRFALRVPKLLLSVTIIVFISSLLILSRLGGEFIPQLEEGDFAVDTRLLTGSSLTATVDATQKCAKVLLDNFPEVEKVVTKIGSGEIPTDPMPLEASDMMVILKPKKEWVSAKSFPELANKMSDAIQQVPGVSTGFQFPVQMRFNELMTGARQDVVCKIFGDDLDTLSVYVEKLGKVIQSIDGAKDLYMETVTGIPQMVITYNREAIAKFGTDINTVNNTIQAAYAGAVAGLVFEEDKRFDLVIRMDEKYKKDVGEIENLPVGLPNGQQIPLYQLAKVEIQDGPYQIQREDARRRIIAGFNVRGRDVQSIVTELQEKIARQIKFPPGYYITYGGQYENLQHATRRLSIALPIALLLILIMLFFAFDRIKYCLLIFTAIPLSAVGGVLALWIRGMPFSISAGVGFIALFGVAVLNGIVLITELNRLKKEGLTDIKQIIMEGTKARLRPVLMTAAVASLGFLPMALSQGAGAEVQRPLATVVIGGLITATLLTLIMLPILYMLFEKVGNNHSKGTPLRLVLLIAVLSPLFIKAQDRPNGIRLQEAIEKALQQNRDINLSRLGEEYYSLLKETSADLPKTQINAELGNINSSFFDNRFVIQQTFAMPALYKRQRNMLEEEWKNAKIKTGLREAEITTMVKLSYLQLQYLQEKFKLLQKTDTIIQKFQPMAALRFEKGETNLLEKTTLENRIQQTAMQLQMLLADKKIAQAGLSLLLNDNSLIEASDTLSASPALFDTAKLSNHPVLEFYRQQQKIAESQTLVEKAKLQPDWFISYTNQSITGWQTAKDGTDNYYDAGHRFSAGQIGIGIPLFAKAQRYKVKASKQNESITEAATDMAMAELQSRSKQAWEEYTKYQNAVQYYKNSALKQSDIIITTANLNYKNGEINYIEWGTLINSALQLQSDYIDILNEFNKAKIEMEYLLDSQVRN